MMHKKNFFLIPGLSLCLTCSQSPSDGSTEGLREDLAGDEEEHSESDDDPCAGVQECAWWSGRLQVAGSWWELDEIRPVLKTVHCSEVDLHSVQADLYIPEAISKMGMDEILIHMGAGVKGITLGEPLPVGKRATDSPGRVMAYISSEGRGASAQFPIEGVLQFAALGEGEPLDVMFDLNFGELGTASGRIRSPTTTPETCRLSDGPAAPSERPASVTLEPIPAVP